MAPQTKLLESLRFLVPDLNSLMHQKPGYMRYCVSGQHEGIALHVEATHEPRGFLALSLSHYQTSPARIVADLDMQIEIDLHQGTARASRYDSTTTAAPVRADGQGQENQAALNAALAQWLEQLHHQGVKLPPESELMQ